MTPRAANYNSHSQPLTLKNQASTYVGIATQLCFSKLWDLTLLRVRSGHARETQPKQSQVELRRSRRQKCNRARAV